MDIKYLFNRKPTVADLDPIYEIPTISLAEKEKVLFDTTINQSINNQGCLLYERYLPTSNWALYQKSHDVADFPAWHGQWIAALAMKLAVEPSDDVLYLLHQAVKGLAISFDATGIDGLLPRSYIMHSMDTPLPWMKLKDQRPTRFWQQGDNNYWFRNGVAKGHYCHSVLALATIIGLENNKDIALSFGTRDLVHKTLLKIAHFLIKNDYKIIDADGKKTEFGGLNWWFLNGFNALQLLAMLRAGKAIGDDLCTKEYDRLVKFGAARAIRITLGLLGRIYYYLGRENAFDHFSDDQTIYTAAFTLYMTTDNTDGYVLTQVASALKQMWRFLEYSQKSYITFIQDLFTAISFERMEQAVETLRLFPDDKRIINNKVTTQTHEVQPICNQYINSHYWKTDYFRKATLTKDSKRINIVRGAQDYLFTYWLGRYFGFIDDGM